MIPRASVCFLLPALLLLPTSRATAQEGQPEIFLDVVEVDVVNIEVVVTDGKGQPIRGLGMEDFEIYEDGERMELTNFYAIQGGSRQGQEEGAPTAGAAELLPKEQQLSLAIVLDSANLRPTHRKRILEELDAHLDAILRPGDQVLVAALRPDVQVLQNFTSDTYAVRAALGEEAGRASGRGDLERQRSSILQAISNLNGADTDERANYTPENAARDVLTDIRGFAEQANYATRGTFASLRQIAGSLSGLPGRRAVLLVSEELSTSPATGLLNEWYAQFSRYVDGLENPQQLANQWDIRDELQRAGREAAADRVTFYTLHAGGGAAGLPGADAGQLSLAGDSGRALADREALTYLAYVTGGTAVTNANTSLLMDRVAADYRDYYSLGYSSPKSGDDAYHRIEVKVPGRDLRLRHTTGYQAKTAQQRMADRTLSALIFDVADNPLEIRVELQPETRDKQRIILPLLVRVPIANLVLVPHEDKHVGRISIVVAVRDAEGRVSEPQRIDVPMEIRNDQLLEAMSKDAGRAINLQVRKGEAKLAVGVRDEVAGVESTLNLNISVGQS